MHTLAWELKQLCERCREGSHRYQHERSKCLLLVARQLTTRVERGGLGYLQMRVGDFERKHSRKLLVLWQGQGISVETCMNRYAHLRWWCEKIGKPDVIPPTNDFIKGARKGEVATVSKAQTLTEAELARVDDPYIRLSLELQVCYGLRCEEAIMIRPHRADQGDRLWLKGTWCKGGRSRTMPIETAAQREVLERAKAFVGHKDAALIPPGKTLAQQRRRYYYCVEKAGLRNMHGLRHAYAQEQYAARSGMASPLSGGPTRRAMSVEERERDTDARERVSEALGHNRPRVTRTYCG